MWLHYIADQESYGIIALLRKGLVCRSEAHNLWPKGGNPNANAFGKLVIGEVGSE